MKILFCASLLMLTVSTLFAQVPENYVLIEEPTNVRGYPAVPRAYFAGDMIGVANDGILTVTGRNFDIAETCNGNLYDDRKLWLRVDLQGIEGWVNYCINPFIGDLERVPFIEDFTVVKETPDYFQDSVGYYFWRDGLFDRDILGNPPDSQYLIGYKRFFRINLREMPNQTAQILDKMTADNVYVVGRNDDGTWLKIVYTGRTPYRANTDWRTVRPRQGWIATFTIGGLTENWQDIVPILDS